MPVQSKTYMQVAVEADAISSLASQIDLALSSDSRLLRYEGWLRFSLLPPRTSKAYHSSQVPSPVLWASDACYTTNITACGVRNRLSWTLDCTVHRY